MSVFEHDRALLDGFRKGDREALTRVYYHYVDDVAALVRRGFVVAAAGPIHVPGARDREAERELTQEVFVRAFAAPARQAYDGLRPYRPYLLRIARNLLVDRARAARHDVPFDELAEHGAEPAAAAPEVEDVHWQQLRAATQEYVAGLDEELRRFIEARFAQERSQRDAAAQLGLSRRRVRTLEQRAQRGLRRWLRKRGLL
jgi:RNA polymerase sigma-70 factor (ECF subfamily)